MRVWGLADPRLLINRHLLGEHREVHALLPQINGWRSHPEYSRFHNLSNYPEPQGHRYTPLVYPPGTRVLRRWIVPSSPGVDVLPHTGKTNKRLNSVSIAGSSRQGISFLVLRHEMLRIAMQARYPEHQHSRTTHPTPLPALALLSNQHKQVLVWYLKDCLRKPHPVFKSNTFHSSFRKPKTPKVKYQQVGAIAANFKMMMDEIRFPHTRLEGGADTPWDRDFSHSSFPLLEYLRIDWVRNVHHVNVRSEDPALVYTAYRDPNAPQHTRRDVPNIRTAL